MGGLYGGASTAITSKEQADHSLPYLLAVAVLDKQVMQAQFLPERITASDVQGLLGKIVVKVNPDYTKRYPVEFCSRITIHLNDGRAVSHAVNSYPGMPSRPFTWADSVDKFDRITQGYLDPALATDLKALVKEIQQHTTRDLFKLLSAINYPSC